MASEDPYNLARFVRAQSSDYEKVIGELSVGRKRSHWIWYIFPQVQGLGRSSMAMEYAIGSREEAIAYFKHELLGPRLIECSGALLPHKETPISKIMGCPDDLKLCSSMTLFDAVSESTENPFREVLRCFYNDEKDQKTIDFLDMGR